MRFHVLSVPHTVTTRDYSACAFTQKVFKLCRMLKAHGHYVIHYGHQDSEVECDEHVTVTTREDFERSYPGHDWRKHGFPSYKMDDHAYKAFFARTITAIDKRKQPKDFLLCTFGSSHRPVADFFDDLIVVESGIGYPYSVFAKFRVFESYAIMSAVHSQDFIRSMSNDHWYDVVIPNSFDLEDFEFSANKQNYFLFLGRVHSCKGVHIAIQICEELDERLIIAGAGDLSGSEQRTKRPVSEYVKLVGAVGPDERRRLLTNAKAVICASTYLEPFCGVQIEAMLSGTPVISSNWGAFGELNLHGLTGYRCTTFEQFVWAARNIGNIDPHACRKWAEQFTLERVADQYEEYWSMVANVYNGKGWYEPNPSRTNLNWQLRSYPHGESSWLR